MAQNLWTKPILDEYLHNAKDVLQTPPQVAQANRLGQKHTLDNVFCLKNNFFPGKSDILTTIFFKNCQKSKKCVKMRPLTIPRISPFMSSIFTV